MGDPTQQEVWVGGAIGMPKEKSSMTLCMVSLLYIDSSAIRLFLLKLGSLIRSALSSARILILLFEPQDQVYVDRDTRNDFTPEACVSSEQTSIFSDAAFHPA